MSLYPDKQALFDHVARHLLRQNARSEGRYFNHEGETASGCVYRAPGGLSCAVGCIIPDNVYVPDMEGKAEAEAQAAYDATITAAALRTLHAATQATSIALDAWLANPVRPDAGLREALTRCNTALGHAVYAYDMGPDPVKVRNAMDVAIDYIRDAATEARKALGGE